MRTKDGTMRPRCEVCGDVVKGKYCWHLERRDVVMCAGCADTMERDGIAMRDVHGARNVMGIDNTLWLLHGFWRRVKVENHRVPDDGVMDADFVVVGDDVIDAEYRAIEG